MYVYKLIYEKQNKGIASMNIGYYSSYKKARKVKKKYQAIVPESGRKQNNELLLSGRSSFLHNRWREQPDIPEPDRNRRKYPCNTEIWK